MSLTDNQLQMWLAFIRTFVRVQRRLTEEMKEKNDLPIAWYDVLVHLYHGPDDGLKMQDLADQMVMSNSGLTRLLDRMIEKGVVKRELCEDDRRVIFAVLTEEGTALIESLLPQHQARIEHYFMQHLSAEEVSTMREGFERILKSIEEQEPAIS